MFNTVQPDGGACDDERRLKLTAIAFDSPALQRERGRRGDRGGRPAEHAVGIVKTCAERHDRHGQGSASAHPLSAARVFRHAEREDGAIAAPAVTQYAERDK